MSLPLEVLQATQATILPGICPECGGKLVPEYDPCPHCEENLFAGAVEERKDVYHLQWLGRHMESCTPVPEHGNLLTLEYEGSEQIIHMAAHILRILRAQYLATIRQNAGRLKVGVVARGFGYGGAELRLAR